MSGKRALVSCFLGVALFALVACSKSRPPFAGQQAGENGGDTTPPAGGDLIGSDSGSQQAMCGTLSPDGGTCGCEDIPLFDDPPNMYFVLDRSGSMGTDDKWDTVRLTVADVMKAVGPRASFGAAIFPGLSMTDQCAAGTEAMPVRAGDPQTGSSFDGPAVTALLNATNVPAIGGTPTSATLAQLTPKLRALKGRTFVVLATDGGPNCNQNATCGIDKCIPNVEMVAGCDATTNCCTQPNGVPSNCLDDTATEQVIGTLYGFGISTFVIGIPGSGPYSAALDAFATAGGTAQTSGPTKYYRVDTTGEPDLLKALKAVAAKVTATCTLKLQGMPDPTQINVFFDEKVVPQNPTNGWTISGNTITLVGTSCDEVLAGDVLDIRIIAGCPTVVK